MSSDTNLIATRYVRALFDLATETHAHDMVKKDMLAVRALLAKSKELQELLISPIISRMSAEKAIGAVLTAIKASDLTSKFFLLLARQRRLSVVPVAIEKYLAELATSRGELVAEITTARPLKDEQLSALSAVIAKSTGKKVELKTRENPDIIGGVQVKIGSRMLDHSIAGKLARLRLSLTRAA